MPGVRTEESKSRRRALIILVSFKALQFLFFSVNDSLPRRARRLHDGVHRAVRRPHAVGITIAVGDVLEVAEAHRLRGRWRALGAHLAAQQRRALALGE